MAVLRATQLYAGIIPVTTWTNIYTVPAGHRVILKNVQMRNRGADGMLAYLQLNASIDIFRVTLGTADPDHVNYEWKGWVVLNPGDVLRMYASLANGYGVVVSGSLLYI